MTHTQTPKRAQGTIEYLVILAVIVIVALIVVTLLVNSADSVGSISSASSKMTSLSGSIGITSAVVDSDGNFYVTVLNSSGENVTIARVNVGDYNSSPNMPLSLSEKKTFQVAGEECSAGTVGSYPVSVEYLSKEGFNKKQMYGSPLTINCEANLTLSEYVTSTGETQSGGDEGGGETCTSFTYSSWSTCSGANQTRTVVSSSPEGCTGGSPVLIQTCTTDFGYTISGGEVTITSYIGTNNIALLPSSVENLPVTSIGDNAFQGSALTSITIPSSITSIGAYACYQCFSLTSLTLSEGVTNIGEKAFSVTGLTSLAIPNSVTSIGLGSFYDNPNLASLTMGSGVTNFGPGAFGWCGLTSVILPDGLSTIGDRMFMANLSLASVTIPSSVTNIYYNAFGSCTSLTSVYFEGNAPAVASDVFQNCPTTVYYHPGATGFTNPWAGKPTSTY